MSTIIIADDDPLVREALVRVLSGPGHRVLAAADGYEAIALLADHEEVDLLIADVRMPGLDGFSLARQAKLMRPHLQVIYITGYYNEDEAHTGPIYGLTIRKPVRRDALLDQIDRALVKRRRRCDNHPGEGGNA